jgi:hypothetical protein
MIATIHRRGSPVIVSVDEVALGKNSTVTILSATGLTTLRFIDRSSRGDSAQICRTLLLRSCHRPSKRVLCSSAQLGFMYERLLNAMRQIFIQTRESNGIAPELQRERTVFDWSGLYFPTAKNYP